MDSIPQISNTNNSNAPVGLQTYTPGSDIAAGFSPGQIVWGRTGNDIVLGYLPPQPRNDTEQIIEILAGDLELPQLEDPVPRDWSDTFVLGDWLRPYYARNESFELNLDDLGLNEFAVIADFNPDLDFIQLHGTKSDYQIFDFGFADVIWIPRLVKSELAIAADVIAIIPNLDPSFELDLDADYFQFTGYTPPEGPVIKQSQQIGTSGFDFSNSITTDSSDNVYVAGITTGTLEASNSGLRDVWINKYSNTGDLLWTEQFGSSETDFVNTIGVDSADNIYLAGLTQGNLGGAREGLVSDAWLAKYDSEGNQQWVQKIQGISGRPASTSSLDIDLDGNIYLSGVTDSLNPEGTELPVSTDFWVAKYTPDGNQQWFQQLGESEDDTEFDESYRNAVDLQGNLYSTGFTTSNLVDTNAGLYDVWLSKHDTNGELEWIRQIGTEDYEWGWGVDTDSNGNVYLGGYTLGDLGGTNTGSYDAWLAKYDSSGNQLWIEQFGTSGDDEAFNLKIDSQDNIFLVGYTDDDLEGTNAGSYDAWVAKFNTDGEQQWIQQFGTPQTDQAYDITFDNENNLYVTGLTDGSLGDTNQGSFDAWIAKLDSTSGLLKDFNSNSTPTPLEEDDLSNFDTILDFEDGQDLLRLQDGLTFEQLSITQGTGDRANDTLISLESTGELLAALIDAEASSLTSLDLEDGQDLLRLQDGLTFEQLSITQGTGDRANDTLISLESTGELLAALIDAEANSLTREDFTTV